MRERIGVLLVNLGTPDSPHPRDVFRYLNEFLTDGRVIDIPWLQRQLLVRGVIVPRRYKQSAKGYQAIWTPQGSPLKVYGNSVKELLQKQLGNQYVVEIAMRYQNPSIAHVLKQLKGLSHLVVVPLFPQYASATTGSVHQKVMEEVSKWEVIPKMTFVNHFYNHPILIKAFASVGAPYNIEDYDHLLFSYHGLPERQLTKADCKAHCLKKDDCCKRIGDENRECYAAQCYATTSLIREALGVPEHKISVAFQSRLGKDPWVQPYTSDVIVQLARKGVKRLLVYCPAFVCDCLETIEEIGVEYAGHFKQVGGEHLQLIPGLNDHPAWIDALEAIVKDHV